MIEQVPPRTPPQTVELAPDVLAVLTAIVTELKAVVTALQQMQDTQNAARLEDR
ncbi:MAG TPA: hypothetical protein VGH29_04805 [Candidatus Binataceae bacterium]|jgi:hypothetical protein